MRIFYLVPLVIAFNVSSLSYASENSTWALQGRIYTGNELAISTSIVKEYFGLQWRFGGYFPLTTDNRSSSDFRTEVDYGVAKKFQLTDMSSFSLGVGALGDELYTDYGLEYKLDSSNALRAGYRFHFDEAFSNRNEVYLGFSYSFNTREPTAVSVFEATKDSLAFDSKTETLSKLDSAATPYFQSNTVVRFTSSSSKVIDTTPLILLLEELSEQGSNAVSIVITGHSDNTGPKLLNQRLSEQRAQEVSVFFEQFKDVTIKGAGESLPIAPNVTPEGRALNRRVDVKVVGDNTEG